MIRCHPVQLLALIRRLAGDARGATIIEFGIVAPVVVLMMLGGFDIAHTLYMRGALEGVVQKAARDSSLESGPTAAQTIDNRVKAQVKPLANNGTVTITRSWFRDYADASTGRFEPWTDVNNNGTCDAPNGGSPGEPYEDTNNNARWDSTGGNTGQGGAKDAVIYTVTVRYPRMFPINGFIGGSDTTSVSAKTILRNQPYSDQAEATVRNCP